MRGVASHVLHVACRNHRLEPSTGLGPIKFRTPIADLFHVNSTARIQVLLYTRQPFVVRGFAAVLHGRRDFGLAGCCDNLPRTLECLRSAAPDIVLVHLASRISLSDLHELRSAAGRSQIVLWGQGLAGEFAFQAMQLGIHGILPADTPVDALLAALRNVHRGVLCFERELMDSVLLQKRITLTK
ncbi:MAG: hypothetical protein ABSH40_19660, partial [Bryobacteraceae bacterium]